MAYFHGKADGIGKQALAVIFSTHISDTTGKSEKKQGSRLTSNEGFASGPGLGERQKWMGKEVGREREKTMKTIVLSAIILWTAASGWSAQSGPFGPEGQEALKRALTAVVPNPYKLETGEDLLALCWMAKPGRPPGGLPATEEENRRTVSCLSYIRV